MITIVKDKPLIEDIFDYDIIIVGTGIHNALGNGFQYDVKINFPFVEEAVKKTPYADKRKLGTVTVINKQPIFCVGFIHFLQSFLEQRYLKLATCPINFLYTFVQNFIE